jgi:hypothetical protein
MGQITGGLAAIAGDVYEYDASWAEHPAGLLWTATVLHRRKVALRPSGVIVVTADDLENMRQIVHDLVEQSIRKMVATQRKPNDDRS